MNREYRGIREVLKLFSAEFGEILSVVPSEYPEPYYKVEIGGGNLPYWNKYPTFIKKVYEVEFGKSGAREKRRGFIGMTFSRIGNKWEFRSVMYGLPASHEDSRARITDISQKMFKLLN